MARTKMSITGGPELAAKLGSLEKKIRNDYAKAALTDGGRIIAQEWSSRAPVGEPPEDEHPGAYRDSLLQEDAVKVRASATGATGSVSPGIVGGIDEGDQPRVYAAKLEFVDSDPAARPAFEAVKNQAAEAIGASLKKSIEGFR